MLKKNLINQHLDHKKQCRWTTLHNKSKDNQPETFKVFLVGLSQKFTSEMLEFHFKIKLNYKSISSIEIHKVTKKQRNKPGKSFKGCGTITLFSKNERDHMLLVGNYTYKERTFFVKPYYVGDDLKKYKEEIHRRRIYIHNIPDHLSNEQLGEIFAFFGQVEDSFLIRNNDQQQQKSSNKKFGYVIFFEEQDAVKAVKKGSLMYMSNKLIIKAFSQNIQITKPQQYEPYEDQNCSKN